MKALIKKALAMRSNPIDYISTHNIIIILARVDSIASLVCTISWALAAFPMSHCVAFETLGNLELPMSHPRPPSQPTVV